MRHFLPRVLILVIIFTFSIFGTAAVFSPHKTGIHSVSIKVNTTPMINSVVSAEVPQDRSINVSFSPTIFIEPSSSVTPAPADYSDTTVQHRQDNMQIIISKIKVNAPVILVGENSDGRMSVPADDHTVGLWNGSKVGEIGSAVLAGHYTIANGSPGVFYRLPELVLGDELQFVIGDKKNIFIVDGIKIYPDKGFPINDVFINKSERRLNLITCTGIYKKELEDYTDRLVIYSKLKS